MKLINELDLGVYPQFNTGKKQLMLSSGKVRTYSSFIPNISPLELLELNSIVSKVKLFWVLKLSFYSDKITDKRTL